MEPDSELNSDDECDNGSDYDNHISETGTIGCLNNLEVAEAEVEGAEVVAAVAESEVEETEVDGAEAGDAA